MHTDRMMQTHWSPRLFPGFALASIAMLVATLCLHLPLMLWDHIDLVPIYDAWQRGVLAQSEFWRIHDGSHFHGAAYAVLLLTTKLSGGRPWLDCVASWGFFVVQAWLLLRIARSGWRDVDAGRTWWFAMLLLVFHPGHLANLQWGWQVAVFIALLGAVAPIHVLTLERPSIAQNLLALALATIGALAFANTLAVFPIAMALILSRQDWPWPRRLAFAAPWLLVAISLAAWLLSARGQALPWPGVAAIAMYALNYLGGGVLRFAEGLAPWWTLMALLTASLATKRTWRLPQSRPWLALIAFALGCAVLTALGRAGRFGADHAFVSRYASFALMFWIGWFGLMVLAWRQSELSWRRWVRPLLVATLVFVAFNGLHLFKKAMSVHERALAHAEHIRRHYPDMDPAVLEQAYGERAGLARERLDLLRQWGFAPFDRDETRD